MAERVRIEVIPHKQVFLPGQLFRGTAIVSCSRGASIDSVEAELIGQVSCSFNDNAGRQFTNKRVLVQEVKELWHFSTMSQLLGMYDENENTAKAELCGRAEFLLNFTLPASLPTSFTSPALSIRYAVQVRVKNGKSTLRSHEETFYVVRPERVALLSTPQLQRHSQTIQLTKGRSIFLECVLGRSVFTTTDRIQATINVNNRWSKSLKYVHMNIVRKVETVGYLNGNTKEKELDVVTIESAGVGLPSEKSKVAVGENYSFSPAFNVPAFSPDTQCEDILKVTHQLRIVAGRAHNYIVAKLDIPIVIVTDIVASQKSVDLLLKSEALVDISPPSSMNSRQLVDLLA